MRPIKIYPNRDKVRHKDILKAYHSKLGSYLLNDHTKIEEMYAGEEHKPQSLLDKMCEMHLTHPSYFQAFTLAFYMAHFGEEHIGFVIDVAQLYKLNIQLFA